MVNEKVIINETTVTNGTRKYLLQVFESFIPKKNEKRNQTIVNAKSHTKTESIKKTPQKPESANPISRIFLSENPVIFENIERLVERYGDVKELEEKFISVGFKLPIQILDVISVNKRFFLDESDLLNYMGCPTFYKVKTDSEKENLELGLNIGFNHFDIDVYVNHTDGSLITKKRYNFAKRVAPKLLTSYSEYNKRKVQEEIKGITAKTFQYKCIYTGNNKRIAINAILEKKNVGGKELEENSPIKEIIYLPDITISKINEALKALYPQNGRIKIPEKTIEVKSLTPGCSKKKIAVMKPGTKKIVLDNVTYVLEIFNDFSWEYRDDSNIIKSNSEGKISIEIKRDNLDLNSINNINTNLSQLIIEVQKQVQIQKTKELNKFFSENKI